jgi:hypothetical protein
VLLLCVVTSELRDPVVLLLYVVTSALTDADVLLSYVVIVTRLGLLVQK